MRVLSVLFCLLYCSFVLASDEEIKRNWTNTAELSTVQTDGNSESSSLGFANNYVFKKNKNTFTWDVFAIRVETTTTSISATGSQDDPIFVENKSSTVASENFRNALKFERDFAKKTAFFVGTSWEQDEPKGIADRIDGVVGVSNKWKKTDRVVFATHFGLGFTQEDLVATGSDDFIMAEIGYDLRLNFKNGHYKQKLNGDLNESEKDDWRVRLENGLVFNLTNHLAFKTSVHFEYNNEPNFIKIDLGDTGSQVNYQLDELDTQMTLSLVLNF